MQVKIKIDSAAILTQLKELGESRQGPFVLSKTLNKLAKQVQANLQQDIKSNLKIRPNRWQFIKDSVKIGKESWSTKTRLKVQIEIQDRAAFLNDFEQGAQHLPINGRSMLALPNIKALGTSLDSDSPLRVKNLHLQQKGKNLEGQQHTFMTRSLSSGNPLILQRVAPDAKGKDRKGRRRSTGLRLLYVLLHSTHRPQRIHWQSTADATVQGEAYGIWSDVIAQALKDSKR